LSELAVAPCDGCETCQATGACHINDDMNYFYDAFVRCDALIIASPTYWRNVPGPLKCVMDRTFAVGNVRPLTGKPGGAMTVGRGSSGGQAIALTAIYNFMLSAGMIAVPGELNGITAVADKPGDILKDDRKLRQAEVLGRNVLEIAEKLKVHGA
jgi:multimeric flavodoxin WrbA